MLTVPEALALVMEHARPKRPERVPLGDALGLVLAEDITSDIDSPPFDKSMVDGYAVVAADVAHGAARLAILEEVTAGKVPTWPLARGQATRIMTGVPIPEGCDAVVMIERTRLIDAGVENRGSSATVEISDARVAPGQNILRQGTAMRRGEVVLRAGAVIRPAEVGLLSEVGRVAVDAIRRPTVAVLPTGNEVVPADSFPKPGQIRNTNGPLLLAAVRRAGGVPIDQGVGRDDLGELRRLVAAGLEADVLVLSGGVSAGVLDLVPRALAEEGVEQVFHKVQFKPGKPLWFGVRKLDGGEKLVFGLPGNPVSSYVCFEMFVRPAMGRLAGREDAGLKAARAALASEFRHRGDRPTYHPARLNCVEDRLVVEPLPWQGSADLRGLAGANALVHFPAGERHYQPGEILEAFWL
jgi:molybdopterin molybdotransferase